MKKITVSEIYRFLKSTSKLILALSMVLIVIMLSLIAFKNMNHEGGSAVLRFMNNAVVINEGKLSEFFRLIFESGVFTFFIGIFYIVFRARLYSTKNIQNIIVETNSRMSIILASFFTTFIYLFAMFFIIFIGLSFTNFKYNFESDWITTLMYLCKQFVCQYAYFMLMDSIIDYTQSSLIAVMLHFAISSGLAYTIIGICTENVVDLEIYKTTISYNFLMLNNVETYIILIVSLSYLLFVTIMKYIRFYKLGEFK